MGVFLGQGGSSIGLRALNRSHWGSGMDLILLLRQTPVRWVSVLERNTSCSFSGVDPAISPRTTIRSGSGDVDPDISPVRRFVCSLRLFLFATVSTERVSST